MTEANDEEENDNKSMEKQEDAHDMVLWDCVSMFDTEKESGLRHEDISKENVTTRIQGLIK